MKAETTAKLLKSPINLQKSPVHFAPTGSIELVAQSGRAHPGVKGRLAGEARMTKSPPHAGEMHPDGDELLYLVEGAVDVVLDEEAGERCLSIQPGQAFIVPRAVWHRVMVKEACRPLYFTPGTEPSPVATPNTLQMSTRTRLTPLWRPMWPITFGPWTN